MTGTILDVAQNNQIIEVSIKQVELFSIISSVISIVLGIVAIVLSIIFYRMSEKSAKEAEASSQDIEGSVKKLETLFDKLYSGTFDMMKETVTDMRKHAYSNGKMTIDTEDISRQIEEKTIAVVAKVVDEIKTSQKSDVELEQLIISVIDKSREFEKSLKNSALRDFIIKFLKSNGVVTYRLLRSNVMNLITDDNNGHALLFRELLTLAREGIIINPFDLDSDGDEVITHDAKIRLK